MRQGVATALIDDAITYAKRLGVARISVIGNPHAADFYQRVGFVTEGYAATEFGPGLRMHLDIRS